jgi:adenosylhomocysteine nucleosidase
MSASPLAPPPVPADVGIVAALPIEVGPLLDRLKGRRKYAGPKWSISEGDLAGKLVALIVAGVGEPAARRGVELLAAGHRPRWVISAGYGGALDPELKRNDVIVTNRVASVDPYRPPLDIDLSLPATDAGRPRVRAGSVLTADRIIRTPTEKAALRREHGCDVVDMETHAVASYCAERSIRFLGVRVVSDEATTELPPEVLTILGPTGGFRLGATMGALWRRPSSVKDLLRLREHAYQAADRLAEVLPQLIERLP